MKDIKRHEIINSWLKREITGNQVSILLGDSYRHALRLKRTLKEKGLEGVISKKRGGIWHFQSIENLEIGILLTCRHLKSESWGKPIPKLRGYQYQLNRIHSLQYAEDLL